MELSVLAVPDCPNAPLLEQRLAEALAGRTNVNITRHVVASETDAAKLGMHGSPTLLVNGQDPFSPPGAATALACRRYDNGAGLVEGAPTVAALRQVLEQATGRHPGG
ncbi:MAG TPA: thioredoxin family protein [Streptosporangiaceae bacterium]|nr:thioredoxin family protein [Streptosporangiaceae bacterium]